MGRNLRASSNLATGICLGSSFGVYSNMKRIMPNTEEFSKIVKESQNYSEVCRKLGYALKGNKCPGGAHKLIKSKIKELGLDTTHFTGQAWSKNQSYFNNDSIKTSTDNRAKPLDHYFYIGSKYNNQDLLQKIIRYGLKPYKCEICHLDKWNDKPIVLELHHLNGIYNDNRLDNLQIICPNCHSQTRIGKYSFSGLKTKLGITSQVQQQVRKIKPTVYKDLNWRKRPRPEKRKVERPTKEVLEKMLLESNYCAVARHFGVSDNAIRKWIKSYNANATQ